MPKPNAPAPKPANRAVFRRIHPGEKRMPIFPRRGAERRRSGIPKGLMTLWRGFSGGRAPSVLPTKAVNHAAFRRDSPRVETEAHLPPPRRRAPQKRDSKGSHDPLAGVLRGQSSERSPNQAVNHAAFRRDSPRGEAKAHLSPPRRRAPQKRDSKGSHDPLAGVLRGQSPLRRQTTHAARAAAMYAHAPALCAAARSWRGAMTSMCPR